MVARDGRKVFHEAFGFREVSPRRQAMRTDTIFDLASLTKPCATALALMLLSDSRKLALNDLVSKWLPAFFTGGKDKIRIIDLATHTGGLNDVGLYGPGISPRGRGEILETLWLKKSFAAPGEAYLYADINYIALGFVIEAAARCGLAEFFAREIAGPLAMKDSGFNPSLGKVARAAATEKADGRMLRGVVHDPRARVMGGVAGHAGLFGTAQDVLAVPLMLLNSGRAGGRRFLSAAAASSMTRMRTRAGLRPRGIGWDGDPTGLGPRGSLFTLGGFGHTGFTGTSVWTDPLTRTVVVLLTNRVHPDGKGSADPLRRRVAETVALGITGRRSCVSFHRRARVLTGADVLAQGGFKSLRGAKVGLVTNLSAVNSGGRSTLALLAQAKGVELKAVFAPEHGIEVRLEGDVPAGRFGKRRIPVHSLYGATRRPAPEHLKELDALLVDLPDIGVRFYTYPATTAHCMEEAAVAGLKVIVLDRPNPLSGGGIEGPVLPELRFSFIGYAAVTVRHGMTLGELARLMNAEHRIGADLEVVRARGWRRDMWFDETRLPWVNPSPNIRTLTQAILYPALGLLEATNLSVGRGTDAPFEKFGAPWLAGEEAAARLNGLALPGVAFYPVSFTPSGWVHQGKECGGVGLYLADRRAFRPVLTGIAIAQVIMGLHPDEYDPEGLDTMIGCGEARAALLRGACAREIAAGWKRDESEFSKRRRKFLLY